MKRLFCLAVLSALMAGQASLAQADGVEFSVGQTGESTILIVLACSSTGIKAGCKATSVV